MTGEAILVWGLPADPPIARVLDALRRARAPVILLDQRASMDTAVELSVGTTVQGRLRSGAVTVDLATIGSVYLRPYDLRDLPITATDADADDSSHALAVQDLLVSWCELTPALVLNRPSDMAANDSKPLQSAWIESLGFAIPDTLITTDREAVLAFWRRHGQIIYKSVSGIRSIVSRFTERHLARLDDLASCPTQFQQYIPGAEYRVHVVGDEVHACAVTSSADDYRYAAGAVDLETCTLPDAVLARCRRVAHAMALPLAGLDLRRTPEGVWYCFEVNPSPAFSAFEGMADAPVADAVARLLMGGSSAVRNPAATVRSNLRRDTIGALHGAASAGTL